MAAHKVLSHLLKQPATALYKRSCLIMLAKFSSLVCESLMSGITKLFEPWHVISNNVAFWQVETQTSLCSLLLNLETLNDIRSVAWHSLNIQATSKDSDQTAHMRRLVWAFAGRTYHIVGNLMSRLIFSCHVYLTTANFGSKNTA